MVCFKHSRWVWGGVAALGKFCNVHPHLSLEAVVLAFKLTQSCLGKIWKSNLDLSSNDPVFHLLMNWKKMRSPDRVTLKNPKMSLWAKKNLCCQRLTLKKAEIWITGWIGKIYVLN